MRRDAELRAAGRVEALMAIARFSTLVEQAGRPKVHLAWSAPAQDPELRRALEGSRLLTVHQQLRGAKTDFGTVGLALGGQVQFLIFPKSLRKFADARVVAIRYDLLDGTLSSGGTPRSGRKPKAFPPLEPVASAAPPAADPPKAAAPTDPVERGVTQALEAIRAGKPRRATRLLQGVLHHLGAAPLTDRD